MKSSDQAQRGFTLLELVVVVAILAALAVVAFANFQDMQFRSKRSELPINVEAIRIAQLAHYHANSEFVVCELQPAAPAADGAVPFGSIEGTGWIQIGWEPGAAVYGRYQVALETDIELVAPGFHVTAVSDIDRDGQELIVSGHRTSKASFSTEQEF